MSKLIIPAAELIGTPLTLEELKGILAGDLTNPVCKCSYNLLGDPDTRSLTISDAKDAAGCETACASRCNENITKKCESYSGSFSIEFNGKGY
ncbi:MAG: hypothetical protein HDR75_07095 [Bacteroides sp.]|nr:hypothetical protein [Bacteroides sp.]MBD5373092.1 hypothetical protein [Bacteroides sp.]